MRLAYIKQYNSTLKNHQNLTKILLSPQLSPLPPQWKMTYHKNNLYEFTKTLFFLWRKKKNLETKLSNPFYRFKPPPPFISFMVWLSYFCFCIPLKGWEWAMIVFIDYHLAYNIGEDGVIFILLLFFSIQGGRVGDDSYYCGLL